MASTPNFNWSTPDNTGLVKNGALDIRTLGNAIDASLVDLKGGTTGQVLTKASNTDMDFIWSADSAGMTNPMTTTGDTIYSSSGSTPARLGIGSTGQVLTVSGGVPTWATPAGGGGKVLQVVQATTTTQMTSTSTSFADSNLTGTITPSATSSKILVIVSQHLRVYRGSQFQTGSWQLVRNSTPVLIYSVPAGSQGFMLVEANGASDTSLAIVTASTYLDSPSTTSATTYKTQIGVGNTASSGYMRAQGDSLQSTIILMEIGA